MYMSNFICHGDPTQGLSSNDISLENVDKSYLEVLKDFWCFLIWILKISLYIFTLLFFQAKTFTNTANK